MTLLDRLIAADNRLKTHESKILRRRELIARRRKLAELRVCTTNRAFDAGLYAMQCDLSARINNLNIKIVVDCHPTT